MCLCACRQERYHTPPPQPPTPHYKCNNSPAKREAPSPKNENIIFLNPLVNYALQNSANTESFQQVLQMLINAFDCFACPSCCDAFCAKRKYAKHAFKKHATIAESLNNKVQACKNLTLSIMNAHECKLYMYISFLCVQLDLAYLVWAWSIVIKLYELPSKSFICYCCGYRISLLGEPYRFPGLCGTQYIRDPTWNQYPFLNRLGNGSMIEELFCWFQVLWQHFMLLSFYINLHPCSFHFVFIFLHLPFILLSFVISLHFAFIFLSCSFQYIPMCIHVLSLSFHLHACSFHFAFMSFYLLSKVVEMVLSLGQGTACNKWLSLSYR